MIKINLMRSFAKSAAANMDESGASATIDIRSVESNSSLVGDFVKKSLVLFLGAAALIAYQSYNIPQLQEKFDIAQNELNAAVSYNQKFDALKAEIEKYEVDLKRINSQTFFLEQIQMEKSLAVDLITKMKDVVDPMVWLTSIQVSGRSVEIKGSAESIQRINQFNSTLSNATYLKDVITVSIESFRDPSNPRLAYQNFTIRASYADIKSNSPDMEGMSVGGENE